MDYNIFSLLTKKSSSKCKCIYEERKRVKLHKAASSIYVKKIKAGGPEKKMKKIAATYFQAEDNQSSGKAMKRKFANTLFKFKARVVPNDCC